jgi:hypothetical protein
LSYSSQADRKATSANTEFILKLSLGILAKAGVKFGAVRVLGGPYLDKHNIMVEHYGVISQISKYGYPIISEAAKEKLNKDFAEGMRLIAPFHLSVAHSADVKAVGLPVGGHEFLAKHPDFSPLALTTINDNVGTTRLAGMLLTICVSSFLFFRFVYFALFVCLFCFVCSVLFCFVLFRLFPCLLSRC